MLPVPETGMRLLSMTAEGASPVFCDRTMLFTTMTG